MPPSFGVDISPIVFFLRRSLFFKSWSGLPPFFLPHETTPPGERLDARRKEPGGLQHTTHNTQHASTSRRRPRVRKLVTPSWFSTKLVPHKTPAEEITPKVWIALASFIREILLGQQGVLVLMMQRG